MMFKLGRELTQRKRQYPEAFKIGENMAEDRFETLPGEDRAWSLGMVDAYLNEVSEDAVMVATGLAFRQGIELQVGALSTIGIACGVSIDPALRKYIKSGAADGDRQAIADYRHDYDRGRDMAETSFFPEPDAWFATAPLIGNGILMREDDIGLAQAFGFNAFTPPFEEPGVARGAWRARMAELIRLYIAGNHEDELRARSTEAAARRAERKKVSAEVEAEFRSRGNYSARR